METNSFHLVRAYQQTPIAEDDIVQNLIDLNSNHSDVFFDSLKRELIWKSKSVLIWRGIPLQRSESRVDPRWKGIVDAQKITYLDFRISEGQGVSKILRLVCAAYFKDLIETFWSS